MSVDIQKIALRRLLTTQSTDFYNKLVSKFFNDTNLILFRKIVKFYEENMRIPTMQEFYESQKSEIVKEYLESQIYKETPEEKYLSSQFIADQLQDYFIREETVSWLEKFMDQLEVLE